MKLRTQAAVAAAKRALKFEAVPTAVLVALADLGMVAREHLELLTPAQRRRLFELVVRGRGRPSHLSGREREELAALVAKMEPRALAGDAVKRISPIPLPHRLLYGRGHRPRR